MATTAAPLLELLLSLQLLRGEEGDLVFGRWRRRVRATVPADRLRRLFELAGAAGVPVGVSAGLAGAEDLEAALTAWSPGDLDVLRAYHEVAVAPYWRSISAQVTSENAKRGSAWPGRGSIRCSAVCMRGSYGRPRSCTSLI